MRAQSSSRHPLVTSVCSLASDSSLQDCAYYSGIHDNINNEDNDRSTSNDNNQADVSKVCTVMGTRHLHSRVLSMHASARMPRAVLTYERTSNTAQDNTLFKQPLFHLQAPVFVLILTVKLTKMSHHQCPASAAQQRTSIIWYRETCFGSEM